MIIFFVLLSFPINFVHCLDLQDCIHYLIREEISSKPKKYIAPASKSEVLQELQKHDPQFKMPNFTEVITTDLQARFIKVWKKLTDR